MKVLHVIPAVSPRYGGPSHAILEICRSLQGQGVMTTLATTDADGPGRLDVELGRMVNYRGVQCIFFSRQWSESLKFSYPLARWLGSHVDQFHLVHIHAVFSHACLAAAKACMRRSVPYVVRPLGSLDPWSMKQKRIRKLLMWHCGVKQMLRNAAAIHYTTAEEQRLAERGLDLSRGAVIPLGFDSALLESSPTAGSFRRQHPIIADYPYVLFLSRLHPKKGVELLIEAFLTVTQQEGLGRWRLVVAGDGEAKYVERLKQLAHRRNGHSQVVFVGWLEGHDKTAAIQDAALFALPSYQENFGIVVVDSLACATPVLISRHVNLADEIRTAGAGWIVEMDHDSLVNGLTESLRSESLRLSRGLAGHDLVWSRYRWPVVSAELVELYDSKAASPSNLNDTA